MKNKLLLFIAAGAVLFANGKVNGQNFVKVSRSNQEQTINLSIDQVLEIQLPRKAATGYVWCEAISPKEKTTPKSIAKIYKGDFIHDPIPEGLEGNEGVVGLSGTEIIRYAGTSQGTTTLTLELKRPWEKNGEILDSYTITIVSAGKYTGIYKPPVTPVVKNNDNDKKVSSTLATLPTSWDWRMQSTPIKDQGDCGSCWAFASVGSLECNILIHDGNTRSLSEQYLINCDGSCNGCQGGTCPNSYWKSPKGAVYETECPYVSFTCDQTVTTATCINSCGTYAYHEQVSSYRDIGGEVSGIPPVDSIKNAIYKYGPIWVAVDAASNAWSAYSGGIWVESGTSTDHAVCLVGWKDTTGISDGSAGYWILRNSYGPSWGENGYMRISYKSDAVGYHADYLVYGGGAPHLAPTINFDANMRNVGVNTIVSFYDLSTFSPTAWTWSLAPSTGFSWANSTTSSTQNPQIKFTAAGLYSVTLAASNGIGTGTPVTKTSYINVQNVSTSCDTVFAPKHGTACGDSLVIYSCEPYGYVTGNVQYDDPIVAENFNNIASAGTISTVLVREKAIKSASGTAKTYVKIYSTNVTTKAPDTLLGTSNSVAVSAINATGFTAYTFATPVSVSGSYSAGVVLPTVAGDTVAVYSNPQDCHTTDSLSWFFTPYDNGWYSFGGKWGGMSWGINLELAIYPEFCPLAIATGIKNDMDKNISIYPNPSNSQFTVDFSNYQQADVVIDVYNMVGKLVQSTSSKDVNQMTIDISNQSSGIYIVAIKTSSGTIIKKLSLIK
ncbi:MAG: C1 family peptidase [Bacteroidales bacterium]